MGKLTERLTDPERAGVYRVTRTLELEDAIRGTRLHFARISLRGAADRDAILAALAQALAFPEWFGGNWDALEDCLTDLSWASAEGYVLVLTDTAATPADELGILLDILGSAAEFWRARARPFFAVIVDPEGALALAPLFRER